MITEDYISIDNVLPLAQAFSDTFDAPVDNILTVDIDENGILHGSLMSAGNLYNYAASDTELGLDYQQEATEELNDYASGLLTGRSVHTDSFEPYEWARGFLRLDVKCSKGTPCGGVCLPKGHKCRKGMSSGAKSGVKQTKANLRSGSGAKVAGGIAAGLVGAAAVGAAGYVGYRNREPLGKGSKAVGSALKRAGTEGYSEVREGVKKAKEVLKASSETIKVAKAEIDKLPIDTANLARDKKIKIGAARGAGAGGATGAVAGGLQQATVKVGQNLKAAGEELIKTGKEVGKNTKQMFKKPKAATEPAKTRKPTTTRKPRTPKLPPSNLPEVTVT